MGAPRPFALSNQIGIGLAHLEKIADVLATPTEPESVARAKAVCSCCPVTERCLTWAMHSGEIDGIWGGLDGDERRTLKRKAELTPASM